MHTKHVFTRVQLYEKVWSIPIRTLAKELGMSDVGLTKLCRRSRIPTPGLGYWRLIETGHSPKREPLPNFNSGETERVTILGREAKPYDLPRKSSRPAAPTVEVNETRKTSHPAATRLQQTFEPTTKNHQGAFTPRNLKIPHIRVSDKTFPRALRIFDALFCAAEAQGHSVLWEMESDANLYIVVEGEQISLSMNENFARVPHSLTSEERTRKSKNLYVYPPQWDFIPTGELYLSIENVPYEIENFRKTWRDGKMRKLENCLGDFLSIIPYLAAAMKFVGQERQRKWQRQQEDEKRAEELRQIRKEYRRKRSVVEELMDAWTRSKELDEFALALRSLVKNSSLSNDQREKLMAMSDWIALHASETNPVSNIDSILFKFHEPNYER